MSVLSFCQDCSNILALNYKLGLNLGFGPGSSPGLGIGLGLRLAQVGIGLVKIMDKVLRYAFGQVSYPVLG